MSDMSNEDAENDNSGIDITLGKIIAYPVGVILILSGIAGLFSSVVSGVLITLSGIIALPYFRSKLRQSQDISFSRWAVVGIVVLLVVAGGSTLDTGGSSLSGSVNDEVIDVEAESLYITSSELEAGWNVQSGETQWEYIDTEDDALVTINITSYDTVEIAEDSYQNQFEEQQDSGTSTESVNFGNEGFLFKQSDSYAVITYRAGNIVVTVQGITQGFSINDAEGRAENFAQDVEDNIKEAQE